MRLEAHGQRGDPQLLAVCDSGESAGFRFVTFCRGALVTMMRPATSRALVSRGSQRFYGGLKDQDRIFTNLYNQGDRGLKGAMKRVSMALEEHS